MRTRNIAWKTVNPSLLIPRTDPSPPSPVGPFCHTSRPTDATGVKVGTRFTLNREETKQCIDWGIRRQTTNLRDGTYNANYSGRNDFDIHIEGVFGEYAFCRLFGLEIDLANTECRSAYTETKFDAVLPNGWTVDVKTSKRDGCPLLVNKRKVVNAPSVYALVIWENPPRSESRIGYDVEPPILRFQGMARANKVFGEGRLVKRTFRGRTSEFFELDARELGTYGDALDWVMGGTNAQQQRQI